METAEARVALLRALTRLRAAEAARSRGASR